MFNYARILVDMELNGAFPESVTFIDENGIVIDQMVFFEWKSLKCSKCAMYGNVDEECRKTGAKKVWRRKETQNIPVQEELVSNRLMILMANGLRVPLRKALMLTRTNCKELSESV